MARLLGRLVVALVVVEGLAPVHWGQAVQELLQRVTVRHLSRSTLSVLKSLSRGEALTATGFAAFVGDVGSVIGNGRTANGEESICAISRRLFAICDGGPQFVYMLQGDRDGALDYFSASPPPGSRLLRLTYKEPPDGALHYPDSVVTDGQSALHAMACTIELLQECGFRYYVTLSDDIRLWSHTGASAAEMFAELEAVAMEWEPAIASPGRFDYWLSEEAPREPVASRHLNDDLYLIHRDASHYLLPHYTALDSECWWGSELRLRLLGQLLYRNHFLVLSTTFSTWDPSVGSYPRDCAPVYEAVLRNLREVTPERLTPCLVPGEEHLAQVQQKRTECMRWLQDLGGVVPVALTEADEAFVHMCIFVEDQYANLFEANWVLWGTAQRKDANSYNFITLHSAKACSMNDIMGFQQFVDDYLQGIGVAQLQKSASTWGEALPTDEALTPVSASSLASQSLPPSHIQIPPAWVQTISLGLGPDDVNAMEGSVVALLRVLGLDVEALPVQIRHVIITVGWGGGSEFLALPISEPDVLLLGFEANPTTWSEIPENLRFHGVNISTPRLTGLKGCLAVLPLAIWHRDGDVVELSVSAGGDFPGCDSLALGNSELEGGRKELLVEGFERCHSMALQGFNLNLFDCPQDPGHSYMSKELYWATIFHVDQALSCARSHTEAAGSRLVEVPSVSLETVLGLLPTSMRVVLVQIDAQGVDMQVFESSRSQVGRVERVILETQALDPSHLGHMYLGAGTLGGAMHAMEGFGFHRVACRIENCATAELDCFFEAATGHPPQQDATQLMGVGPQFLCEWLGAALKRPLDAWCYALSSDPCCNEETREAVTCHVA